MLKRQPDPTPQQTSGYRAWRKTLTPDQIADWDEFKKLPTKTRRRFVQRTNNPIPCWLLGAACRYDRDWQVRADAAYNRHCPPDAIADATLDPHESVRRFAVRNPHCPPDAALHTIRTDPDFTVQLDALIPLTLHPDAMTQLVTEDIPETVYPRVIQKVLRNPRLHLPVAVRVFDQESMHKREYILAVLQRVDAPATLLYDIPFATKTRALVATDPRLKPETLLTILLDPAPDAHLAAGRNPNLKKVLTVDNAESLLSEAPGDHVRAWLGKQPTTSLDVLRGLPWRTNARVAAAVASNPNTPVDILADIPWDIDPTVAAALAANPNTPTDIALLAALASG